MIVPKYLREKLHLLRYSNKETKQDNFGISIGIGTRIQPPRKLTGASNIFLGDFSYIGINSWLAAFDQYAGIQYSPKIRIGNHVDIGDFACITCISEIIIEDYCVISEFVYISDHVHGYDPEGGPILQQPLISKGNINIGRSCLIGYRVCILPGVTLGKNCVVGANSVVTHSFPEFSMIGGAPARLIKRYSPEDHDWIAV